VVRTFWKSRFTNGVSYFGKGDVRDVLGEVVSQALKKSAATARQKRKRYSRLRMGKSY
jgi:hypothetical protein